MIIKTGDIWKAYDEADLFCFPANGYVKKDGRLTMGAGMAKQVVEQFPEYDIALAMGRVVRQQARAIPGYGYWRYGLIVSPNWPHGKLALFQTKIHWREPSSIPLIRESTLALLDFIRNHPDINVHMGFPGTGHGGLDHYDVLPTIMMLPDNVHVWTHQPWWKRSRFSVNEEDISSLEELFEGDPDNFYYSQGVNDV